MKQEWKEEWLPEFKNAYNDLKNKKTFYKQIPNLLTASRLLSPFIIIPLALTTNITITFIVAAIFALTDALDGFIARKYNLQSKLGKMLDPFTDKLFALGLLIPNIGEFVIPIIIILILEGIIAIINCTSKLKGNEPTSNLLGKTKTTFLSMTAISMYLSDISWINTIIPILITITLLLQIMASIVYKKIDLEKDKTVLRKRAQNGI